MITKSTSNKEQIQMVSLRTACSQRSYS